MATIAASPAASLPLFWRPKRELQWPPGTGPGAVATQNSSAAPMQKSTPGTSQEDAIIVADGEASDDNDEDSDDEDGREISIRANHLRASLRRSRQTAGDAADAMDSATQDRAEGRGSLAAQHVPRSKQIPMHESEVGSADRNTDPLVSEPTGVSLASIPAASSPTVPRDPPFTWNQHWNIMGESSDDEGEVVDTGPTAAPCHPADDMNDTSPFSDSDAEPAAASDAGQDPSPSDRGHKTDDGPTDDASNLDAGPPSDDRRRDPSLPDGTEPTSSPATGSSPPTGRVGSSHRLGGRASGREGIAEGETTKDQSESDWQEPIHGDLPLPKTPTGPSGTQPPAKRRGGRQERRAPKRKRLLDNDEEPSSSGGEGEDDSAVPSPIASSREDGYTPATSSAGHGDGESSTPSSKRTRPGRRSQARRQPGQSQLPDGESTVGSQMRGDGGENQRGLSTNRKRGSLKRPRSTELASGSEADQPTTPSSSSSDDETHTPSSSSSADETDMQAPKRKLPRGRDFRFMPFPLQFQPEAAALSIRRVHGPGRPSYSVEIEEWQNTARPREGEVISSRTIYGQEKEDDQVQYLVKRTTTLGKLQAEAQERCRMLLRANLV